MRPYRTGIGFDVHQLVIGRPLIIGGIEVPHSKGALGHSDGDVLIHAIIDALLGASALGDIGQHFPDSDPTLKNIDSSILLKRAVNMITKKGFSISSIDSTVILQAPKLADYIAGIREKMSQVINLEVDKISVKATTTEQLGYIGAGEGISAMAVVNLLDKQFK